MAIINTQVAVLGGGPGGYAAAFMAADLGLEVTLIDLEPKPGGVCLYRGCIPSKALLHISKLINETREASAWGLTYAEPEIDLDRLRSWKDEVIAQMTGGLATLTTQRKVNYIQGRGAFLDGTTLEIERVEGGKDVLIFEHAILATGSQPIIIPSLWLDSPRVVDSTGALELADIPEKMLVVGGGYIGLELGSVYAALGSKVSVVEMTSGLLPGADRDLVRFVAKRIDSVMESVMLNTKLAKLEEVKEGIKATFEGEKVTETEQVFDKVLFAIGRRPVTKGLGLENTRIQITERGFVKTNAQGQTDEPTIYAIGDISGEPMLAHKATAEGRVAAEAIAGHKVAFEPQAIPAVVFTDPELAWCGLTETQAKAEKRNVQVFRFPWAASGRATTLGRNDGLTKLIIDPETERILGMGIVGPGAGELIAEGVLAVEMAALASDVGLSIHPHPTLSETVMESADMFFGHSTHVYRPKRK